MYIIKCLKQRMIIYNIIQSNGLYSVLDIIRKTTKDGGIQFTEKEINIIYKICFIN
jgi:hypothetical protein